MAHAIQYMHACFYDPVIDINEDYFITIIEFKYAVYLYVYASFDQVYLYMPLYNLLAGSVCC